MDSRYERTQLSAFIGAARRRWRGAVLLRGLIISLALGGPAFLTSAALVDHFHYAQPWVIALRVISVLIFGSAVGFFLLRPLLRKVPDARMALFIEERNPGLHDRLVSAVEFADQADRRDRPLVGRLIHDAAQRTASVDLDTVASRRRLQLYAGLLAVLLAAFGWLLVAGPESFSTGLARLYAPWSEAASVSPYTILVQPGNVRVPKGSDQTIVAGLQGFDAERVEMYIKQPSQPSWMNQAMELDQESRDYRFSLFNLQEDVWYYVRAGNVRSPEFKIEVADLARVQRISLTYHFPTYTSMPVKTVEDGGDIVALKGTRVRVLATLNRPAEAAKIVLEDGAQTNMEPVGPNQFAGEIVVKSKSTYRIDLTSGGETYAGSNVYEIVALDDEPPVVTIDKPGRDMKVTNIEEVFTQARAEDDNGVAALELHFSINGEKEQTMTLYRAGQHAPKQITGAHTFFLEEYNLQPGDFISFYATAKDGSPNAGANQGASDIYFLEIRPFDRTYRQAQQNPNMQGSDNQSALTQRQKEIIAATWRVIREQPTYTPPEFTDNMNAITLIQDRLRQDTESLANRIRQRFGHSLDEQAEFKQLTDYLEQAAKQMQAALKELKTQKPKEALSPEQRALQQLMRADAVFREIQVAFGNNSSSGEDNAKAEDLADLFELELDKMKNQYETIQRDQGQRQDRQLDETLRKLQELARRQQQQAEQQARRSMQGGPRNQSGGGGGSQQQQLMEEAKQLARQLDRLSRERRDERLAETSRQLKRALEEMQRAQQSGTSAEAAARSQQAAEQLEAAKRQLQSNQQARGQDGIRQLRERATQAAERQREIAKDVEDLARAGHAGNRQSSEAIKRRLQQRKENLAGEVEGLKQDIEAAAQSAGGSQSEDQLKQAANAIQQTRLPDKIRQGNQLLETGSYDQARQREKEIRENLNQVARHLQSAEGSLAGGGGKKNKLEEALNRTRQLADDLESLQRRLQEQAQGQSPQNTGHASQNRQNQNQQGQPTAQPGNQPSRAHSQNQQRQNQQPRPSTQPGNQPNLADNNQTPFSSSQNEEFPSQGGPPRRGGDPRQLDRELSERLRDAEALQRQLGNEFGRDVDRLIRRLRQLDDERLFNDPEEIARLKSQLVDPLRQLEQELARRLQAALGQTGPRLIDETSVPEAYRKLVEEYYKRLASKK